jgi:hypothetical protein
MLELWPVFRFSIKEDCRWFGHRGEICGRSVAIHWMCCHGFCVSMFVCFIAAISIASLSACSISCFCVFAVNTAKFYSYSWSCHHVSLVICIVFRERGWFILFFLFGCWCGVLLVQSLVGAVHSIDVHLTHREDVSLGVFVRWLLKVFVARVDNLAVFVKVLLVSVIYVFASVDFVSFVVWYASWVSRVFFARSIYFLY